MHIQFRLWVPKGTDATALLVHRNELEQPLSRQDPYNKSWDPQDSVVRDHWKWWLWSVSWGAGTGGPCDGTGAGAVVDGV